MLLSCLCLILAIVGRLVHQGDFKNMLQNSLTKPSMINVYLCFWHTLYFLWGVKGARICMSFCVLVKYGVIKLRD